MSVGQCYLCMFEDESEAVLRHVTEQHACPADRIPQECCLLKIEGADDPQYWLYLDIPLTSMLKTLDTFLRKIWLECCGHWSAFRTEDHEEYDMKRRFKTFNVGEVLHYEYDFGSSTYLRITIVSKMNRAHYSQAVRLLGRNLPPEFSCAECGVEAVYTCPDRIYEGKSPYLCEKCVVSQQVPYALPVVNSPRMGVCGYEGQFDKWDRYWYIPKAWREANT